MSMFIKDTEYLTTQEAAKYIGSSGVTFKRLAEKYEIENHEFDGLGRKVFWKKTDLDRLLEKLGRR